MNLLHYKNLDIFNNEIINFSSTRKGGVSKNEYSFLNLGRNTQDNKDLVEKNFELLSKELCINSKCILNANQIHSIKVLCIDDFFIEKFKVNKSNDLLKEGWDAMITNKRGFMLTVTTADCVPILLYDNKNKVIGVVHSGWRGTAKNIIKHTIEKMKIIYNTVPNNIVAAIGPCIDKDNYEVNNDVYNDFFKNDYGNIFSLKINGKYLLNLKLAVSNQLKSCGVKNIEVSKYSTFSEPELFFSVRRQGQKSGRQLSGIMLK